MYMDVEHGDNYPMARLGHPFSGHNLFPYHNPNRICSEFNPSFDINPVITWSGRNYRWWRRRHMLRAGFIYEGVYPPSPGHTDNNGKLILD